MRYRFMYSKSLIADELTSLCIVAIPNNGTSGYYMVNEVKNMQGEVVACSMQKMAVLDLKELAVMKGCTSEQFLTLMSQITDAIVLQFEDDLDKLIKKFKDNNNHES